MPSNVNNFDVLKRMAAENKDIRMANSSNILKMNYNAKRGTDLTFGVEGNVVFAIQNAEMQACVLLFDVKQFNELKALMEKESL